MRSRVSTSRPGCRVLLAEAHILVRDCLRDLLEGAGHEVVGEARDGLEASRLADVLRPEIAILDLSMPVLGGLASSRLIQRMSPQTRLIALGADGHGVFVTAALAAGFSGFVVKHQATQHLARSIEAVRDGAVFVGPSEAPRGGNGASRNGRPTKKAALRTGS